MRGIKRQVYGFPLMAAYRDFRVRHLADRHRSHPLGFSFAGADAFFRPEWEASERKIAVAEMGRAAVFIDIGANQGVYTCLACSKGLDVVAIEPERGNLRFLLRNLEVNGFAAEVHQVALSSRPGVARLFGDGDTASVMPGWAETARRFVDLVPSNTIDNLIADRWPGERMFIKIDVEGAELDVLHGAGRLIARDPKPSWLIETFPFRYDAARSANPGFVAVFEMMFAAGYDCRRVDNGERVLITDVQSWIGSELSPESLGGLNFLFTGRGRGL